MSGFTIKVEGVDEALGKFNAKLYQGPIQQAFDKFGIRVEQDAKQLAPVDEGALKSAIFHKSVPLGSEVGCSISYAGYLEFGTRKFAAEYVNGLPQDWKELAAQGIGKGGGDYYEFLNAILDWVMRKGIASRFSVKTQKKIEINLEKPSKGKVGQDDYKRLHDAAFLIARKIMKEGIKPHPFLYPAFEKNKELLLKDLSKIGPKI